MSEQLLIRPAGSTPVKSPQLAYKRAGAIQYFLLALLIVIAFGALFRSELMWNQHDLVNRSSFTEMSKWTDAWTPEAIRTDDPITLTSYFIEEAIPGPTLITHRAVNLLLHFVAAVLLLNLLQALKLRGAFFATLLFALHPVAVQTLLWPGYRNEIVGLILILSALFFGIRQRKRSDWVVFFILGSIAALAHPVGLLLPIFVAGFIFMRTSHPTLESFNPILPLLLACLFIALWIDPNLPQYPDSLSSTERSFYLSQSMYFHLRQTLLPVNLELFYKPAAAGSNTLSGAMGLLPHLLYIPFYILIFFNISKLWAKALCVGITSFLLSLLYGLWQTGNFIDGSLALENHTVYIALPAMITLIATGLITLADKSDSSIRVLTRIALSLITACALLLSATFAYQASSDAQMWKRLSEGWPNSWLAQVAYMEAALNTAPPTLNINQVISLQESILEKNPDLINIRLMLAENYAEEGLLTNALREYNLLLRREDLDRASLEKTATFYRRLGMNKELESIDRRLQQLP